MGRRLGDFPHFPPVLRGSSSGLHRCWELPDVRLKPFLLCPTLLLAACQSVPAPAPPAPPPPPGQSVTSPGRSFAEAQCSGCHGVVGDLSSSNPDAPPFAAIANQEGLTEETLATWLRGAHNYPAEMNFYLNERQVNELVAYFLSLKSPNYRRPPD
jgi:mono/diheme cytochrome c family protein